MAWKKQKTRGFALIPSALFYGLSSAGELGVCCGDWKVLAGQVSWEQHGLKRGKGGVRSGKSKQMLSYWPEDSEQSRP